jgi:hypothetical protein
MYFFENKMEQSEIPQTNNANMDSIINWLELLCSALLSNNLYTFCETDINSMIQVLTYQDEKICLFFKKYIEALSVNSWFEYKKYLDCYSKHQEIIEQNFDKNGWINEFSSQIVLVKSIIERSENKDVAVSEIIKHIHNENIRLVKHIGSLLVCIIIGKPLPSKTYYSPINEQPDMLGLNLLKIKNQLILNHIPETYITLTSANNDILTCIVTILGLLKNDQNENVMRLLYIASDLFGNYLRESYESKENFNFPVSFDLVSTVMELYKRFPNNDKLLEKFSCCLRYIVINTSYFLEIKKYGGIEAIVSLLKNKNPNIIQHASRCIGDFVLIEVDESIRNRLLKKIRNLMFHDNENIVYWAIKFFGNKLSDGNEKDKLNINKLPNDLNIVTSILKIISTSTSYSNIEAGLWTVGTLSLILKFTDELDIILKYTNTAYLQCPNIKNAEIIILFACRCLANLISSSGVNKMSFDSIIHSLIPKLLVSNNEKITVWALCFIGTVSSNSCEYNTISRSAMIQYVPSLVKLLISNNNKYVEAALWSLHKIAWCEQNQEVIRKEPYLLEYVKKILYDSKSNDKVIQSACLCFSVIAQINDSIFETGIKKLIDLLSACDEENVLIACRSLNTLCTANTKGCMGNRKLITSFDGVFSIINILIEKSSPLLLESVLWCLGNLALFKDNVDTIRKLAIDRIVDLFLDKNEKVIEGACFCFCNVIIECPDINIKIQDKDIIEFLSGLFVKKSGKYIYHDKIIETACWGIHKLIGNSVAHMTDCVTSSNLMHTIENNFYTKRVAELGVFRDIIFLLGHSDERVVACACWCFGKLVVFNDGIFWAIKLGAIKLLLKYLKPEHQRNEKLTIFACRCLITLIINSNPEVMVEIQNDIRELGGIELLLDLIAGNNQKLTVLEVSCWCLASLTTHKECKLKIQNYKKNTGLKIIANLLNFRKTEKILEAACVCLSNLLDRDNCTQIDNNIIKKLSDCLLHQSDKIVEKSVNCLKKLSYIDSFKTFIIEYCFDYLTSLLYCFDNIYPVINPPIEIIDEPKQHWFKRIISKSNHISSNFSVVIFFENNQILDEFLKSDSFVATKFVVFNAETTNDNKESILRLKHKKILTTKIFRNIEFGNVTKIQTYLSASMAEDIQLQMGGDKILLLLLKSELVEKLGQERFYNYQEINEKRHNRKTWSIESQLSITTSVCWCIGNITPQIPCYSNWIYQRLSSYLNKNLNHVDLIEATCYCIGYLSANPINRERGALKYFDEISNMLTHENSAVVKSCSIALGNFTQSNLDYFRKNTSLILDIFESKSEEISPLILLLVKYDNTFWINFSSLRTTNRTFSDSMFIDSISNRKYCTALSIIWKEVNQKGTIYMCPLYELWSYAFSDLNLFNTIFDLAVSDEVDILKVGLYFIDLAILYDPLNAKKTMKVPQLKYSIYEKIDRLSKLPKYLELPNELRSGIIKTLLEAISITNPKFTEYGFGVKYEANRNTHILSYENRCHCDIVFELDDGKIEAHKYILSNPQTSLYFKTLIDKHPGSTIFRTHGVKTNDFELLFKFIYDNQISFNNEVEVIKMFEIGQKFGVNSLIRLTKEVMIGTINEKNYTIYESAAKMYQDYEFVWTLINWFCSNYNSLSDKIKNHFFNSGKWEQMIKDISEFKRYFKNDKQYDDLMMFIEYDC